MPDELERQLRAFGDTLAAETGEPVSPETAVRTHPHRRSPRRWAIVGAAACVVAVLVGFAFVGTRGSAPSAPTSTSDAVDRVLVPAPDVPVDALGLAGDGWTLTRHSRSRFAVIDEISCDEMRELDALDGHEVVIDEYTGSGEAFLRVTQLQYADRATALDRLTPLTDLRDCEAAILDGYEQLDLDASPDVEVSAHRQTGSAWLAVVDADGGAVLLRVGNAADDETLQLLVERASTALRREATAASPEDTTTPLDDLAALVGEDPLGLQADGWEQTGLDLTRYESMTWPVCGTATEDLDGAATVAASYGTPSGAGVFVQLVRVDEATARAALGAALVARSPCPSSSEFVLGDDVVAEAQPAEGRWTLRGPDLVRALVAPPGDDVLPLVAIVSGTPDAIDGVLDRADAFLSGEAAGRRR